MLKLMPSDPRFEQLDFLLTLRARLKNPAVHFDLKDLPQEALMNDLDDLEWAIEMMFILQEERSM